MLESKEWVSSVACSEQVGEIAEFKFELGGDHQEQHPSVNRPHPEVWQCFCDVKKPFLIYLVAFHPLQPKHLQKATSDPPPAITTAFYSGSAAPSAAPTSHSFRLKTHLQAS